MFEIFTDRARRATVLAQEEARQLNHNYIGTEHLLLGLLAEGEGVAAQALNGLGLSLDDVTGRVVEVIGVGQQAPAGHIPFTPRAKKALELARREGLQLGHNYVGTEHLLLGLVREGEGVAAQVLVTMGAELTRVRQQVIQLLSKAARENVAKHAAFIDDVTAAAAPPPAPRLKIRVEDAKVCLEFDIPASATDVTNGPDALIAAIKQAVADGDVCSLKVTNHYPKVWG